MPRLLPESMVSSALKKTLPLISIILQMPRLLPETMVIKYGHLPGQEDSLPVQPLPTSPNSPTIWEVFPGHVGSSANPKIVNRRSFIWGGVLPPSKSEEKVR